MIIDQLLSLVVNLIRGLVSAIPEWVPDLGSFAMTFSQFGTTASILNGYFPVALAGAGLAVVFGARALYALWTVAVWTYEKIPFKAT